MPRIMRRTPESEEAAGYGYKGLLRDIIEKISTGATKEVARMTGGGLSKEELLEMALAPAGGMLKVAGTGKLLAGLLSYHRPAVVMGRGPVYKKTLSAFKEALLVPEKEYGRIKDIKWSKLRGRALGTRGEYDPRESVIRLLRTGPGKGTVWHEFTHARQWAPEKGEEAATETLRMLNQRLAARGGLSGWSDFYHNISPIEKHARNVAMTMTTGSKPSEFSRVYKGLLESALLGAEEGLTSREIKEVWGLFLKKQARGIGGRVGDIAKLSKTPKEAKSLMKTFSKEGLKYDAFTEPLPGHGYYQWTLYGEGPTKGATFGTKTTDIGEMQEKITELMRKFSK